MHIVWAVLGQVKDKQMILLLGSVQIVHQIMCTTYSSSFIIWASFWEKKTKICSFFIQKKSGVNYTQFPTHVRKGNKEKGTLFWVENHNCIRLITTRILPWYWQASKTNNVKKYHIYVSAATKNSFLGPISSGKFSMGIWKWALGYVT